MARRVSTMHLDERVIFFHNPRTSGTGIRRALLLGVDPNREAQWPDDLGKHLFPSQLKERIPAEVWDSRVKFATVRNPWARMVSLYYLFRRPLHDERYRMKNMGAKLPINLAKFKRSILRRTPEMELWNKSQWRRFAAEKLNLSFLDWFKFSQLFGWQACGYLGDVAMTAIPQGRWHDGVDRVFRMEDREEIDDFLRSNGYPVSYLDNTTKHAAWESYYDGWTYDEVLRIFRDDVRQYGY